MHEDYGVRYWTGNKEKLAEAVRAVGNSAEKVEQ
jgi:hypothetical protein